MFKDMKPLFIAIMTSLILLNYRMTNVFNCNTEASSTIELNRGDTIKLCIHFLPYGVKAVFDVEIDKFQGLSLTRGYEALSKEDTDLAIQLENSTTMSNANVTLLGIL